MVKCTDCDTEINGLEAPFIVDKKPYCEECTVTCEDCEKTIKNDDANTVQNGDRTVCDSCQDDYRTCQNCNEQFHRESDEWGGDEMCTVCQEDHDENEFPYRDWKKNKKLEVFKQGKFLQSPRLFGIEVEANYPNMTALRDVADVIHEDIGIAMDSGAEFQTPPACGEEAEKMIKKLTYHMRKQSFAAPNGCGLHIHVDAADLEAVHIKNLYLLYIVFDDVIRSVINGYRQTSNWCEPTKDVFQKVMKAETQEDLEKIYYGQLTTCTLTDDYLKSLKSNRKAVKRKGFNLQCLFAEKHLEIRYHESTLSGKRMMEWANLHTLMMDRAKQGLDYKWIERMHERKIGKMNELFKAIGMSPSSKNYWKKVKKNLCAAS